MKTQMLRIAVIAMTLLAASAAMAQGTVGDVVVNVPFGFVVGTHQMQPGRYVVGPMAPGILGIVDTKDPRSHRPYHVTSRLHLVSTNYKPEGDVDDYVSNGALCHGSRGRQQRHRDYSNSKHLCFHTILPRRFEPQVVSCPRGVGDGLLRPLTAQAGSLAAFGVLEIRAIQLCVLGRFRFSARPEFLWALMT